MKWKLLMNLRNLIDGLHIFFDPFILHTEASSQNIWQSTCARNEPIKPGPVNAGKAGRIVRPGDVIK